MITADRARELLNYDPVDGIITWRITKSNRCVAGKEAGWLKSHGVYQSVCVTLDGRKYPAHRVAWLLHYGEWPASDLDHIDGDATNNRIANLRLVTKSQNQHNRAAQRNNSSGFKGVWRKRNKWSADIWCGNRKRHLGTFNTAEEAGAAYERAAAELHGEYRRTA